MHIRILSFNIHKGIGWGIPKLTINQIHEQLHELDSDIIFLQEVQGSHFETLASGIWPHFSYGKNAISPKGHHGNAILSKFPISFSDNINISMHRYERRGLLHAMVDVPHHSIPLHLICVHLGLFRNDRKKQIKKIIEYMQLHIPEHAPLILGGDFNDWNTFATIPLVNDLGLHEAFLSNHGKYANTFPAWAPILKLDRIYARGFHIQQAHRLTNKSWRFLSDHIAIEAQLELKI